MATRKKATRKTSRRRSAQVGEVMKVSINGVKKQFRKASCHTTKGAAKAKATSVRDGGKTARVVKNGKAYCVYVGPSKKKPTRKKTTTRSITTRRRRSRA